MIFSKDELYIILKRRNLEICEHSSFTIYFFSSTGEAKDRLLSESTITPARPLTPSGRLTPNPDSTKKDVRRNSSRKTLLKVFNGKAPGKRQVEFTKIFSGDIPDDEPLIADFR